MRLIDIDKLVLNYGGLAHLSPYDSVAIAKYFMNQIEAAPTIALENLARHGRWIEYDTSAYGGVEEGEVKWLRRRFFRCSECRKGSAVRSCYCPNCGAKMDSGGDNDGDATD